MEGSAEWRCAREVVAGGMLSVIMPVYRLADSIESNLASVARCLDAGGFRYELVPVDDGSGDGTADALRRTAARRPDVVRPVWVERNAGKGNALKEGFRASRGEFVLLLDGDLDIAPKMLPGFFESMARSGSDVVVGSKRHPESKVQYPWHRRLASVIYYTLVRIFIGLPVTDTQTGMKLFRRGPLGEALDRMLVKTYAFDLELLAIACGRGAKISEAPVEIRFGQKFGALKLRTVREMMTDTLAVFYRLRLLQYYAKVEVPPPLERNPLVSVVIACPGGSWMLDECLRALAAQTYRDIEVLVLPDEPIDAPEGEFPPVRVLPTGKVRPAEKRNVGIREAKGDVVAFIDDDAYPDAHWIENAVKYFGDPAIGGVGGPGVTPPGDGFLARAGGRVYENVLVSGGYRYRYVGGRVLRDVDDYPSCNLFVRTDLLRKFGGYRTDFWPGEDTLLCRSIVCDERRRIVYDPWTLVYHHRRPLFGPHLRQLGRYAFHRGYFVKRFPENSLHLSYFVPSAFVLYSALLAAAWAAWAAFAGGACLWAMLAASAPMAVYLALTWLSSFAVNPLMWAVTWAGVAATHLWYGVRFVQGLCASRAPCEYIGRDHAGGARAVAAACLAAALSACAGCASALVRDRPEPVAFGGALVQTAPLVEALAAERRTLVQALNGSWKDRSFQAQCVVKSDGGSLRAVFLAPQMRLVTIDWGPKGLRCERAPQIPREFEPERALFDIAFVNLPAETLRRAIGPRMRLEECAGRRALYGGAGELVAEVVPGEGGLRTFRSAAFGYEYVIRDISGGGR